MGITPQDLLQTPGIRPQVPTFGEYVPVVLAAIGAGAARTYGNYLRKVVDRWGDRRLDEVTPTEVETLMRQVQAEAVQRRNFRGGTGSGEHLITALRCVYRRAVADRLIADADDPARKVAKPRRPASQRIAIPDERLGELVTAAATRGRDPELDALIVRFHIETACRRGGLLRVRPKDLDVQQCLVMLREKGGTFRRQPVSPTLMSFLLHHVHQRGAPPDEQLLRYLTGGPVGRRRYDGLFMRIGRELPWVTAQGVSAHWLRHTTLTWVERVYGYGVALAYAGHAESPNDTGTTARYVKATLQEVATALAGLTGEPHPLALSEQIEE
ncbi:site-specific integrase [Actinoplanes hulinensis]|uniref:Site-specific integrase n=2 Tax=Actinoplanes hulinensis TaxID=1144547 RepID=A0ABS7BEB2_9ACTN|nr:site-specific integrase [Actinoplanes hulinensis]